MRQNYNVEFIDTLNDKLNVRAFSCKIIIRYYKQYYSRRLNENELFLNRVEFTFYQLYGFKTNENFMHSVVLFIPQMSIMFYF